MRWIISFPCWGNAHRDYAINGPFQSVLHALAHARITGALIIINTDWPASFKGLVDSLPHEVRFYRVPDPADIVGLEGYRVFGDCHRQAIDLAKPGDRVALLCGDMTVSEDAFSAAETIFGRGKKLIIAAASSTVGRAPLVPARKLLDWSLQNLTPMCRALFWKEGRGSYPWCVYFRHAKGIDFRGFHLHAFAVVKHAGLTFPGTTSDVYLSQEFPTDQVHVVTRPDELALVERSPATRDRPPGLRVGAFSVVSWATAMGRHATPRHLWHFGHQITLQGEPDASNQAIADNIIARIDRRWEQEARGRARRERVLSWLRSWRPKPASAPEMAQECLARNWDGA